MICVIGGSGFLGSALAKRLAEQGGQARIFDLVQPGMDLGDKISFVKGDIRDFESVKKGVENCDIVYHTAGLVPSLRSGKDFYETNLKGTQNILEAAEVQRVKRLIFYSTSQTVFGLKAKMPITEESPQSPVSFSDYGKSKYQAEILCRKFRERGLNVSIVRPCTIIGPGRIGSFKILFDWIKNNKPVFIIGGGKNKIQYISLRDLVEASLKLRGKGYFQDFNLGTDRFSSFEETVLGVISYAKSRSRIIHIPYFPALAVLEVLNFLHLSPFLRLHYKTLALDFYFDISKAKKELDWHPQDSNIEMFQQAYEWYLK